MSASPTNHSLPPLLEALSGKKPKRTPVWFMRQAGRYLPEYRELRSKHSLLNLMTSPELAAEITLQPIRRFDIDAAIVFADILTPLVSLSVSLDFVDGEGPKLSLPSDINGFIKTAKPCSRDVAPFTIETLKLVKKELISKNIPLIGFCGSPFTVAAYLIEGESPEKKKLQKTKEFMRVNPSQWHALMSLLTTHFGVYLLESANAGADAVQIFDSWIGGLSPYDFSEFVLPHVQNLVKQVRTQSNIPIIYFGLGNIGHFNLLSDLEINAVGVDWSTSLSTARRIINRPLTLQGNLDPSVLLIEDKKIVTDAVHSVMLDASSCESHIFNVGHGVTPATRIDAIQYAIEEVRRFDEAV